MFIFVGYDYPDICVNVGYENADEGREEGQETSMAIMSKTNLHFKL